jgi:hypothetical protein
MTRSAYTAAMRNPPGLFTVEPLIMDAEFCVGTGRFSMAGLMGRRCRWSLLSRVLARVPAQFQIADGSLANTSQAVNALQFARRQSFSYPEQRLSSQPVGRAIYA